MLFYTACNYVKEPVSTEPAVNYKLERFVQAYSLTEREKEVLQVLTESDGNVSNLPARCVCQGLHCTGTFQLSMKRPIQVQE